MHVLLINPPSAFLLRSFSKISAPDIPLNLAYIAAVLEAEGHFVRIIDMNFIKSKAQLKQRLNEANFEVLGFTSTTPIFKSCASTITVLKKRFPQSKVILGGWHGSVLPLDVLRSVPEIDFVVKGEGEITIRELIRAIESGRGFESVLGIAYRTNQGVIIENANRPLITNIDSLPIPARHLLPLEDYKKAGLFTFGGYYKKDLYFSSIMGNRGCTGKCTFCGDSVIHKGICRNRSPESIIAEIKQAIKKFNIRIFGFVDANFMNSPVFVKRFCELIIENRIKIVWVCAARVENATEDLLRLMKRAGCIRVSYGVESGSPRVLKIMKKNIRIAQIRSAIYNTKNAGIIAYAYYVYGIPGETIDDVRMSRQLLMETRPHFVTNSIVTPYPGTELYAKFNEEWHLSSLSTDHFFNTAFNKPIETAHIKQVFRMQKKILRDFYLNPSFLIDTIKHLGSIYQLHFYVTAFLCFIKFVSGFE